MRTHIHWLFSWAAGTLRRELCKEVAELLLEHHSLHFKATSATVEQLEMTFMSQLAVTMQGVAPNLWNLVSALLDSREYRHRKMLHPAGHIPAPEDTPSQNEMDLGELGGDEPYFEDNNDGDEEDDGVFDLWYLSAAANCNQKTVVIISICMQNTNKRCNCLQGWMGFFMKSTGVPEKVIKVMAHAGLSVNLSTIYNMVTSILKEISRDIKREVHTLCAAFAYDNFDIAFNVAQPTLENHSFFVSTTSATVISLYGVDESNEEVLRSSAKLWASDPKNPSPSLFPLMNESRSFLMLHKKDTYNQQMNPTQLSGQEEAFAWHIYAILIQHNQNFKHFADKLDEPETIQRIPIHKTNQIPCCSMNIKQSTTDRNIEVLDNLFHQGGIRDKSEVNFDAEHDVDMTEHVILVHGDLLTKEWVDSVRNSQKIEHTPKNRLQYVVFLPGLFHYKMACADALWCTYIHPKEGCEDDNSLYQHIGIL
ncbi:uncharacterized protein F5891DRAFT_965005 [Suillus fuscotomentosus]|uniref:DUF6589 domain-containing protein n=1 Tax=Suillus fuscotomentosus TaxID=1912939 RepID=A0AAD4DQN4_9AGAM|nr:uncharacterized protein F5891DRAFT_965005 [Suillus fuscotomentosus]KAG1890422.1 hypothetical protein F5891DRAFT_965005 [Suillus fuscotomentosus]